jgi:hypothetical protein
MKRFLVPAAAVVLSVAGMSPAGAGVTPRSAASVFQRQEPDGSSAIGTVQRSGDNQADSGTYHSDTQLGSGRYRFTSVFDPSDCQGPHDREDRMTLSGTATIVRSDGARLDGTITGIESCFSDAPATLEYEVTFGTGTRDLAGGELSFGGSADVHLVPGGEGGGETFEFNGTIVLTHRVGYWMVSSAGEVYAFGGTEWHGNARTFSADHLEPTRSGDGYWIVDTLGQVFAFGDAPWFGNANRSVLAPGEVITTISATPSGHGYWLFTDRGRTLAFGDAVNYGDLVSLKLNGQIVASVATPSGHGYYMVALDGGVFAFGDARFHGSMGGSHLNQPVVGVSPTANGAGYWLVAADGGIFAFDAPFRGSMGSTPLTLPVIGMVRFGTGYLMVAQDGGIFDFSDEPFFGSLGGVPVPALLVGVGAVS